ncbi:MAG: hypothetical protein HZC29_03700 [Thaumarchaeota archaeon]|nr:hypothetical protein [Nitrososphaerota archaeon]
MTKTIFQLLIVIAVLSSVSLVAVNTFADTSCRRDCEPPTLGVLYTGQRVVDNGLTINDKSFDVAEFTQTISTTIVKTGEVVAIKLIVYENSGAIYLRNTSVSIGDYADDNHKNMLATISFKQPFNAVLKQPLVSGSDVSQSTSVIDPNGLLKNVSVKTSEVDSYRTAVDISFKVVKPFDTSDIVIQTMDAKLETGSNVFYDGIKVTGKEIIEKISQPVKNVPPPLKQIKAKITAQKIECRDGLEKIIRNNGAVACVSTYTADMMRNMGLAS